MVLRKMILKKSALGSHKSCLLNHHFSPNLAHTHSEQRYYISDLSKLYMAPYR